MLCLFLNILFSELLTVQWISSLLNAGAGCLAGLTLAELRFAADPPRRTPLFPPSPPATDASNDDAAAVAAGGWLQQPPANAVTQTLLACKVGKGNATGQKKGH